jgi:dienelactone hydrolase
MRTLLCEFIVGLAFSSLFLAQTRADVSRVLPDGQRPNDARLKPQRTLNDAFHPWLPPTTREEWEQAAQRLREQVLVATGLWPLPEKAALEPVIHGRIDRGDYTVEKVYFASRPGHYVTGSLFRPKHVTGRVPGVLCPHGHWQNGRFYDAGPNGAAEQLRIGAELYMSGARYPLQARMVQLARMGCVVFHYDMVGNADNQPIDHRGGFNDPVAELWLQNKLGLQTWNSIRALDFLTSLPDVDPDRIGVTGASGGGTQTFMLCAVDPRPAVAFPAVMVSTAMQGGCVCENASYLRQGINNITLAALFAPKPLAMSGADDWTIDIETKGLPELKQVYSFYGQAGLVSATCYPQFQHNYNQISRELMFNWFNQHLRLGLTGPIKQTDFWPLPREELTVFDADHPVPQDALAAPELRNVMTRETQAWLAGLLPGATNDMTAYRQVIGPAARVMLDSGVPEAAQIEVQETETLDLGSFELFKGTCGRKGADEQIPLVTLIPRDFGGTVVLWFDGHGKSALFNDVGAPQPAVAKLLDANIAVASADLFLTGEFVSRPEEAQYPVQEGFPGYTFAYNRPLLSHRVHDILTLIGAARAQHDVKEVHLVATGAAGPWALLARGLAADSVTSTAADLGGFTFNKVSTAADSMLLPGALRYGDIGGIAALAAPAKLAVYGAPAGAADAQLKPLAAAYGATGGQLTLHEQSLTPEEIVRQFVR